MTTQTISPRDRVAVSGTYVSGTAVSTELGRYVSSSLRADLRPGSYVSSAVAADLAPRRYTDSEFVRVQTTTASIRTATGSVHTATGSFRTA